MPGTYVGDKVGAAEGADVGLVVGNGVGALATYVGDNVGLPEGAGVGDAVG